MVGKKYSLLTKIKNAQQCGKSIFDVGCPCHLAHLCVEEGAEELSLNIKDMIRSYIIISIEVSRENLHSVYIIKHVSTCWLSLRKCLDRMLTEHEWDALWSLILYQTLIWMMMHMIMKKMTIPSQRRKGKGGLVQKIS